MIRTLWRRLFPLSLSTRLTLLLVVGVAGGASVALLASERARVLDAIRARDAQVAVRVADLTAAFRADSASLTRRIGDDEVPGVRPAPQAWPAAPDEQPRRALATLLGDKAPKAALMPAAQCLPRSATPADRVEPCWYVAFSAPGAEDRLYAIDLPLARVYAGPLIEPAYLALMIAVGALIAAGAAYIAGAPLLRLTEAARAFARTLDAEPIRVEGPREIRTALETFNQMQARMREAMRERTQILAAITHDLQTPLTRLRLRLEQVENAPLRERLLDDLAGMQRMVREGLDLAESRESREPWSTLNVDSLLSSLAEDAAEAGQPARFLGGAGARVRAKPEALTRCLQNLLDNALRYGGDADLSSRKIGREVELVVRDHGPGIPEADLETVFEPFRQLDLARSRTRGGTGLGLTIARAKAELSGAQLGLANHPEGGLVASLSMPLAGDAPLQTLTGPT